MYYKINYYFEKIHHKYTIVLCLIKLLKINTFSIINLIMTLKIITLKPTGFEDFNYTRKVCFSSINKKKKT